MKRILIVEDEEMIRSLYEVVLAPLGYRYQMASNGKEALEIIAGGFGPDLIITDVNMPELNGLELARQLRSEGKKMPIIFMSGNLETVNPEDLRQLSPLFMEKPFKVDVLLNLIGTILDTATQAAA